MRGDGHTAYGGESACIDSAVETYLITLRLPPEGTVCRQDTQFTPLFAAASRQAASAAPFDRRITASRVPHR
jgi:TAP-like protein